MHSVCIYVCVYICIYIYIYIYICSYEGPAGLRAVRRQRRRGHLAAGALKGATPTSPTNIVGFRGFDSSIILIYRGGIPRPIGDSPESLRPAMLVGTMLVGRLGVIRIMRIAQAGFKIEG